MHQCDHSMRLTLEHVGPVHRSAPAKLQRERLLNLREIGNYLVRTLLNHGHNLVIGEASISDTDLDKINAQRLEILGACEFKNAAHGDGLSLPLALTKSHVVTWCFGELPIDEDTKPYFKIMGLATQATHAEDVAALLKFEGTKYDLHLSGEDRLAADLLRRAVTRGPSVYLKPNACAQGAAHASPSRVRWVEDTEELDKLMPINANGKSKYLCDTAFAKRMSIRIIHDDGSEVELSWRGALVYTYTQAMLVKTIKKLNSLLADVPGGKRKRGKRTERFVTAERLAKRAAKAAKSGSRPRTNTAQLHAAQAKLEAAISSKEHRTAQRDAARAKAHAYKHKLAIIKTKLQAFLAAAELEQVKTFVGNFTATKAKAGGDQHAKYAKLLTKVLDADVPSGAADAPSESEYDSDSESAASSGSDESSDDEDKD
jgi:hypothetical protein